VRTLLLDCKVLLVKTAAKILVFSLLLTIAMIFSAKYLVPPETPTNAKVIFENINL
jgi:hypothetical protein